MEKVIVLGNDGLDQIEKSIIKDVFGTDDVDELLSEKDTPFDKEVQEIIDDAPELVPVED